MTCIGYELTVTILLEQYLCDKELAQAFHIARTLGMPLLIEGEPGTGKTELPLQFAASQQTEMFVYPAGSKSP